MDDIEILTSDLSRNEKFLLLLEKHIGVIIKETKKFSPNIISDQDDYMQQALLGMLTTAIKTFDATKKIKFVTHLVNTIRGYIQEEHNKFRDVFTISSEGVQLFRKTKILLGKELGVAEIAAKLEISEAAVENIIKLINARSSDQFDNTVCDELNLNLIFRDANLTDQEKQVVDICRTQTLRAAAKSMKVSHETIRKLKLSALEKIKSVI